MSLASLEREIRVAAQGALNNRKLRNADIQEWSTSPIKEVDGEVVVQLSSLGVYVAVKKECDKRKTGK